MKKKFFGLLIAIMMAVPAYASITVSPTRIEINANKVRNNYATVAIEIRGEQDKATRYRAYTDYFEVDENAKMKIPEDKNNSHNIASKIRFVPSEFTVPPGGAQKVRVNVANIRSLVDGESRAVIYFEDVEPKEMNVPNEMGISAKLVIKTRVAVPVYVDKGNFIKKGDIETFEVVKQKNGLYTKLKVVSTGNSRIRYEGRIQIIDGKKLVDEYPILGSVVGDNNHLTTMHKIKTDKLTKDGEYTLRLILSYLDEKDIKKNIKKDTILKITGEI